MNNRPELEKIGDPDERKAPHTDDEPNGYIFLDAPSGYWDSDHSGTESEDEHHKKKQVGETPKITREDSQQDCSKDRSSIPTPENITDQDNVLEQSDDQFDECHSNDVDVEDESESGDPDPAGKGDSHMFVVEGDVGSETTGSLDNVPFFCFVTQKCPFPRTYLTLNSTVPTKIESFAIAAMELICSNIYNNHAAYDCNKKIYHQNIVLLFYFFPIFLTSDDKEDAMEEIKNTLRLFTLLNMLPPLKEQRMKEDLDRNTGDNDRSKKTSSSSSNNPQKEAVDKKNTKVTTTNNNFHTLLSSQQLAKLIKSCKAKRYRKAAKSLIRDDVVDPKDQKTYELFLKLHPQTNCDYEKLKDLENKENPISHEEEEEEEMKERWQRTQKQIMKEAQMLLILDTLIKSLKDDKAVGPTNWNNGAIKQFYKKSPHFRKALTVIAIDMEEGIFPFPHLLTDSLLIGIWKNPEHTAIRPIAVANNLSKVLITAAWKHRMQICRIKQIPIQHNQFGISVTCGAELPAFVANEYYKQKTLLKTISLDITNAFNSINREEVIRQVAKRIPALLPLVKLLYLHDSRLTLSSGETIYSKQGVRQGCPLSPLLFSLAIDEVLEEENKIAEEYGAQVVAYLDDHTFIQDTTQAKKELTLDVIINRIQPLLNKLHLELNKEKCYVFEPLRKTNEVNLEEVSVEEEKEKENENKNENKNENEKEIATKQVKPTLSHTGVVLLGIPIGTEEFIKNYVKQELREKIQLLDRLSELPVQIAYHMLRMVIAPSTNFLARALGYVKEYFWKWDEKIYFAVFTLANQAHDYIMYQGAALENWDDRLIQEVFDNFERLEKAKRITTHSLEHFYLARNMTWLASRRGGLGITITSEMATDAWIASHLTSIAALTSRKIKFTISEQTKQTIREHVQTLNEIGITNLFTPNGQIRDLILTEVKDLQRKLTDNTQEKHKQSIIAKLKDEEEFRHLFCLFEDHQGAHANRVLIKPPTFTKTYFVENRVMQEIITQTLLLPNDLHETLCYSNTGDSHNCTLANHMNACSFTGMTQVRHTRIKRELGKVCRVLNLPVQYEQQVAEGENGPRYRADIYLPTLNVIIDVTCVQTSKKSKANLEQVMKAAYDKKSRYYEHMENGRELLLQFTENGTTLIPMVFGPRGQVYEQSWKDLLRELNLEDPRATITEARGNIPVVMNTVAPDRAYVALALLRALAFHVAVDTAVSALKWQDRQRLHWNVQSAASMLTTEASKRRRNKSHPKNQKGDKNKKRSKKEGDRHDKNHDKNQDDAKDDNSKP